MTILSNNKNLVLRYLEVSKINKNIQRKRKIHRRHKRKADFTNTLVLAIANSRYNNETDNLEDILRVVGVNIRNSDGTHRDFVEVLNDLGKVWKELRNDYISKMVISHQMGGLLNGMEFYVYFDNINKK